MAKMAFTIRGRVQGVGYRYYAMEKATMLGVDGEVYNSGDGCVRGIASHEDPGILEQFFALLRRGPGHVTSFMTAESFDDTPISGFRILH